MYFGKKEPDAVGEMAGRYLFQHLTWAEAWPDYMITSKKRTAAKTVVSMFNNTILVWPIACGILFIFFALSVFFSKKPGSSLIAISASLLVACIILLIVWWIAFRMSLRYIDYAEAKFSIYYNRWDAETMHSYRDSYMKLDKWKVYEPKEPGPAWQGDFCYAGFEEVNTENLQDTEEGELKEEEAHEEYEQDGQEKEGSGIDLHLVSSDDDFCDDDKPVADDCGDVSVDTGAGEPADIVGEEAALCSDTGGDSEAEEEDFIEDKPDIMDANNIAEEDSAEATEASYIKEILEAEDLDSLVEIFKKYQI